MQGVIWCLLGVIILGFYNGLLLLDDKTPESDIKNKKIEVRWHFVGAVLFLYLACTAWYIWSWVYIPFVLSSFWLLFGGIVQIIGLRVSFFYVGTMATTDKMLRAIFKKNTELGSAILKILSFIASIILILVLG